MLEKTIKEAVKKRLRELGCYAFWPVQTGFGSATLDCLGCYRPVNSSDGIFFAVECKRPGGKLTFRQQLTIELIKHAGGRVYVIDNVEAASKLLEEVN